MILGILSTSKHPWWWLLRLYQCPSILDDDDWDFINIQASMMMIIGILSMSKNPWWRSLGFDPCPSILDEDYWDLIRVQAFLIIFLIDLMFYFAFLKVKGERSIRYRVTIHILIFIFLSFYCILYNYYEYLRTIYHLSKNDLIWWSKINVFATFQFSPLSWEVHFLIVFLMYGASSICVYNLFSASSSK